ncbi:MAG TPA: cyclase family protein [Acidimicrobiia bacterium]|nr:cyclase family protein [Acidimicrobiia bacterium]
MTGSNAPLPPETAERNGRRLTFYDLSDCLSNATSEFEFNKHQIVYIPPEQTVDGFGLGASFWPDGVALQAETVTLSTHSGTHVDAPAHYGPSASGETMTIDQVPLSWCYGPGVLLDARGLDRVQGITSGHVESELERIGHELAPGDIVLVMTGTDLRRPGYENTHAGLRRDATEYLVDRGVRMIGIDAWTVDRAVDVMVEEAKAGTLPQAFESHMLGREKPYLQIERLANLDQLPHPTGFTVAAFPFKLEGASASWARVVAIADAAES